MTTIHAKVSQTDCYLKVDGSLTSGMVGVPVSFEFGPEWKGLKKTAVFHAGTVKRDRINIERSTTVPAEVLQKPMENLYIGIYGYREDGTIVIPTVMAKVGMILRGANPSGDPGTDPDLPIWAELEQRVSDLEEGSGDAAVKSVNGQTPDENGNVEVKIPEGSSGVYYTPKVSFPGANVLQFEFEPSVEDMPSVPSKTITIPAGKDGVGIKSVVLNSDYTLTIRYTDGTYYTSESIRGEKGEDGITPHIGDNGNWFIGDTDTGEPSRIEDGVKSVNGITPDENGNVKITIPDSSQNVDLTGYAKETWVQESFQPKGDYLTEHQSLDGYAKTEDIPTKPEDIGAQPAGNYLTEHQDLSEYAKKTEIPSVPVQSVNGKTGAVDLTASDVGALPNTTVIPSVPTKVSAFENDKGYLTDYTETDPTVPSWAKQPTKPTYTAAEVGALPDTTVIPTVPTEVSAFTNDAGYLTEHQDISGKLDKNQGSANVGKILVVGSDGNLTLTDMPEGSVSGDVIGVLDASNNILLSGNLANGTYTLKYENADGTYTDIGTLEVGEAGPAYINLAEPNATNTTDYTIWCNEARLASTGAVEAKTGYCVSNFVKVSKNQTLRFKNFTLQRMGCYNESKTALANACGMLTTLDTNDYIHSGYTVADGLTTLQIKNTNVAYIRISGQLTGTAEDVIITVDQEIV